jgi:uncharacterized cupredoxin-like copper-binding protein
MFHPEQYPPRPRAAVCLVAVVACFLAVACSGSSADSNAQPTDVNVTLRDFKINPSVTTYKVGVPYHFVVTNSGSVNHEFMVVSPPKPGESSDDLDKEALGRIDDANLKPGSTQTVTVTFTKPVTAGTLEFACHVPGHYEQGMHLPITVTA